VLDTASPEQIREGRAWYRDARREARQLAREYGVSTRVAAGVIAALSPQLRWSVNLRFARQFLAEGYAPTFGNSRRKAARIVNGEPPLSVLRGPKTRAFFACIYDPNASAICIDRHAHDLALAKRHGERRRPLLQRKGGYERFCDAYRLAADKAGLKGFEVQAIAWVTWRAA